jgi:DNA polymerase I - 3''-5'' exonuclease and polymerase domains
MIIFDLETELIDRGRLAPAPVCVASTDGGLELIDEARPRIERWLANEPCLANHNIAFDMACLAKYWPDLEPAIFKAYDEGRVQCTLLREKVIDIGTNGGLKESYSLANVAKRRDLASMDKDSWRLGYAALRNVPLAWWPAGAREYPLEDVRVTKALYELQERESDILALVPAMSAQDFALYLAGSWGVHTDRARTEALLREVEAKIQGWRQALHLEGLAREDGSKDQAAALARMAATGSSKVTATGRPCLDADACTLSGDPVLVMYSDYASATSLRSKVEDLTYGYDLPLQTSFNSLVETCRTSSRKPLLPVRGWQAQNPPALQGLRECLTPRPGCVFLIADYPSAELHSVAEVCLRMFGFSCLSELLNAGRDLHCDLAARTLGRTYEEVYAGRKGKYKAARALAKSGNYGLWGGMGVRRFILQARAETGVTYSHHEVERLKVAWHAMLPETRKFFNWIDDMKGCREHFTMRHPITGFQRSGLTYCSGANFTFQHLTATAAKSALWEITRRCYVERGSALYGWRVWNFPHDEFCLEGPEETGHSAAIELAHVASTCYNHYTPHVPITVEPVLTRLWSKDASPVWRGGRLCPWEGPSETQEVSRL